MSISEQSSGKTRAELVKEAQLGGPNLELEMKRISWATNHPGKRFPPELEYPYTGPGSPRHFTADTADQLPTKPAVIE